MAANTITIIAEVISQGVPATPIQTRSGVIAEYLPTSIDEQFGASTTTTTYATDIVPTSAFAVALFSYIQARKSSSVNVQIRYRIKAGADINDPTIPQVTTQNSQSGIQVSQASDITNFLQGVLLNQVLGTLSGSEVAGNF